MPKTSERAATESALQQHVTAMAAERDSELAVKKLREPCRKVLESLTEHLGEFDVSPLQISGYAQPRRVRGFRLVAALRPI